ncbi:MAG: hypothetical protein ACJATI_004576 [Halioglobus sp.]|jgi:hypothetical protein
MCLKQIALFLKGEIFSNIGTCQQRSPKDRSNKAMAEKPSLQNGNKIKA